MSAHSTINTNGNYVCLPPPSSTSHPTMLVVQASPTNSTAENIPPELWERIIYHTNARKGAFLGPPTDIANLGLVCRSLNRAIRFKDNPSLYARLFCFKFDYQAPLRRIGRQSLTIQSLAREFKKRIVVLKQVRRRECSVQDLWTCYLMMLENDGRNERQLIEWAHLIGYLKHETCVRYEADLSSPRNWFRDTESTSLLLWLWWMTFSRDDLRFENSHVRDCMVSRLLHNFVVASFRYPNLHGPESHLHLPLNADEAEQAWSTTPPTPVVHVDHYSKKFDLATPLLSLASLLTWATRLEIIRENSGFDRDSISSLPPDRADAIAHRVQGPTQIDILKFHEMKIETPAHCSLDICTSYEEEIIGSESSEYSLSSSGSRRYDTDWYRSVACSNPFSIFSPNSNQTVYRRGALVGLWEGFFMTSMDAHIALVVDPNRVPSENTAIFRQPLYFILQEHHCFHPNVPVSPGNDCLGGDDSLNAWLPQGLNIQHNENGIDVYDPVGRTLRYETYVPEDLDTENHWQMKGTTGRKSRAAESDSADAFSYRDEDLLTDILVTGETPEESGAAWGHFVFVGRVRLWDGCVVLLRTPRDPARTDLGRWVFRGYLHDHNLVGHWRETSTSPRLVGYQGGFVAASVQHQN